MLCDKCQKNQASTTIKRNINGEVTIHHLCTECAVTAGLSHGGVLESMLGSLFSGQQAARTAAVCGLCGSSYEAIARSGKAGCPQCYTEFRGQLLPSLKRIHGETHHHGKAPAVSDAAPDSGGKVDELGRLREMLSEAIERQDFEQAAVLRDQIKEREAGRDGREG